MNTWLLRTLNSTYELDIPLRRVRRLEGDRAPTARQGADGEWKTFLRLFVTATDRVFFDWSGRGHGTLTSPVREITPHWAAMTEGAAMR